MRWEEINVLLMQVRASGKRKFPSTVIPNLFPIMRGRIAVICDVIPFSIIASTIHLTIDSYIYI
jgi:hypothetical protein